MEAADFDTMRARITCPTGMRLLPMNPDIIWDLQSAPLIPDSRFRGYSLSRLPDDIPTPQRVSMVAVAHRTIDVYTGEPLDVCSQVIDTVTVEDTLPRIWYSFYMLANHAVHEEARYDGEPIIQPHGPKKWNTMGIDPALRPTLDKLITERLA